MIETQNLTYQYSKNDELLTFPDITLKHKDGLLILGKSGIGKTTLLHLFAGLLTPTSGSIKIDEIQIETLSSTKLDAFRGSAIGLVFQKNRALRSLTVVENLQARLFFNRKPEDMKVINDVLLQLDLDNCKHKKVNELSVGQSQRLGIAMAIVHKPKLILADEPTSSLDDENCNRVMKLLLDQAAITHANLIVITHDHRVMPLFSNVLKL
ncbi:ABC transporter ATP-binding protein [Neptunitalea chrysea]|uniref:ABC transporter ATP-binding protein n=1 Tax=Neptunitalea chrysea TaxID=1647581 RepID=A0A9W6B6L3_9FLAO|nr:ATP-binding cassette domain-containing protein [Neptunitalea chrysea]GLB53664.1 ABC transporter ATP-binding protein [Neptunitalea chrysea]